MKRDVLQEIIEESLRFKRKGLSKLLQQFVTTMEKNGNSIGPVTPAIKSDFKNEHISANSLFSTQVNHHS